MQFEQSLFIQIILLGVIFSGEAALYIYYRLRRKVSAGALVWQKLRAVSHGFALAYLATNLLIVRHFEQALADILGLPLCLAIGLQYLFYLIYRIGQRKSETEVLKGSGLSEFTVASAQILIVMAGGQVVLFFVWLTGNVLPIFAVVVLMFALLQANPAWIERLIGVRRRLRRGNQPVVPFKSVEVPQPKPQIEADKMTRREIIRPIVNPTRLPIPFGSKIWAKPEPTEPDPSNVLPLNITGKDYRMKLAANSWITLKSERNVILIFCRGLGSLEGLDLFVWWPSSKLNLWAENEILAVAPAEVIVCNTMRLVEIKLNDWSTISVPQRASADLPDATAM